MRKCVNLLVAGVLSGISVSAAVADSVSYTTTIGATSSLAPQLQQFNPSLGTLTGISISLNVAVTPIVQVFSINGAPVSFTEAWTGTDFANAPTPITPSIDDPFTIFDPYNNANITSTDYSWNYGGGTANPGLNSFTDPNPVSLGALVSIVPGADFSNYIGTSTYQLNYTSTTTISSQGSSLPTGLFYGSDRTVAGSAEVIYTYTTPLPTSVFGGVVLLSAMAMRKRRNLDR